MPLPMTAIATTLPGTFQKIDNVRFGYIKPGETTPAYTINIGCMSGRPECDCPSAMHSDDRQCKHTAAFHTQLVEQCHPKHDGEYLSVPIEFTVVGEFAINPGTGEIVGVVDASGNLMPEAEVKKRWMVDSREKMEWAMRKLFSMRVEQNALVVRIANLQRMQRVVASQEKHFLGYVGADMAEVAKQEIEGTKKKSLSTEWGTVGFRHTSGSIKVLDMEAAVAWACDNAPDAVKVVESVTVTPLKGMEDSLPGELFAVEPAGDKFYFSDGLPKPDAKTQLDYEGLQW